MYSVVLYGRGTQSLKATFMSSGILLSDGILKGDDRPMSDSIIGSQSTPAGGDATAC